MYLKDNYDFNNLEEMNNQKTLTKPFYKNKLLISILLTVLIIIILSTLFFIIFHFIIWSYKINFELTLIPNSDELKISWNASKEIDEIIINTFFQNESTIPIKTYKLTNSINSIKNNSIIIKVYYGIPLIQIKTFKKTYSLKNIFKIKVPINKINIAPLSGSMPVTLFTIQIDNITDYGNIKTYFCMQRNTTWDYNNLPKNVLFFPFYNIKTFFEGCSIKYHDIFLWIKDLYESNKNIEIKLFLNDVASYVFIDSRFVNNIPYKNLQTILLSDGTSTYNNFNKHFDNSSTYIEEYNFMKKKWIEFKNNITKYKKYNRKFINEKEIIEYNYIMVKEEKNVFYWINKINGTMAPNNKEILKEILNLPSIKLKDINTIIKNLNISQIENLKKLFNFKNNYFEEAEKQKKEIMLIIGTIDEYNTTNITRAIKKYYGNKFIYYYKPHPGLGIIQVEEKMKAFKNLNITNIPNDLPVEIIFFFIPNIYVSGYSSTSFISLDKNKCCALYNYKKTKGSYFDKMDFFISYVNKNDVNYGKNVKGNDNFVLEFNTGICFCDYAIYEPSFDKLTYYNFTKNKSILKI